MYPIFEMHIGKGCSYLVLVLMRLPDLRRIEHPKLIPKKNVNVLFRV